MIVCRVEDIKDSKEHKESHVEGQVFIGLGYAFGINESPDRARLKIRMTLLSEDSTGSIIDAPSDLGGYPFVRYRSFEELRSMLKSGLPVRPLA
jgi:hypothetical protein